MSSRYVYHFSGDLDGRQHHDGIVSIDKKILNEADLVCLKKNIVLQLNSDDYIGQSFKFISLTSLSFLHEVVEGDTEE